MNTQTRTILLSLVILAAVFAPGLAQTAPSDRPPREEQQTLTDQQKATVKSILSKYNPASLTADDARAINDAFREAGLRSGRDLRDAIQEAGFDAEAIRKLAPPPNARDESGRDEDGRQMLGSGGSQNSKAISQDAIPRMEEGEGREATGVQSGYSLEQATSDRAQLNTIAFDGLAFMTGDLGCNTFLPPGKVADFCGFQYMRDMDSNKLGHNTSFVTASGQQRPAHSDGRSESATHRPGQGTGETANRLCPETLSID